MRKIIVSILAVSVLLGGCSKTLIDEPKSNTQKNLDKQVVSSGEIINEDSKKIMAEYVQMMKEKSRPYELMFFIDKNIKQVLQENADEMIIELEAYQNIYSEKYTEILFSEDFEIELMRVFSEKVDEEAIDEIADAKLKELMYEMIRGGYKFISLEGKYYPIIDYKVLKKYKTYLSNDIKEYIELRTVESNQVMSDDAGLQISLDQLGSRVMQVEQYIKKYPNSKMKKQASNLYLNYFQVYIWGLPNTLLWDAETKKISDEALNSYKKIVNENKDSDSGKALKAYIKVIKKNNMRETDQINQFRDGLYKEVVQKLNLQK